MDFRLWDVNPDVKDPTLLGLQFTSTTDNWRRLAHKIADEVYKKLTGEAGYFDTRVVFVSESGPKTRRSRHLMIMDQDGANPSYLTEGVDQIFTPRYSSTSQEITYMELRDSGSAIYLFNTETGRASPRTVSRHGVRAAFFRRRKPGGGSGQSEAATPTYHAIDWNSRFQPAWLTAGSVGIDFSPSFSPNGGQIVFNSDRGGSPQIYMMNC